MKFSIVTAALIGIALSAGCSSSNDDSSTGGESTGGNGTGNYSGVNATVAGIASADSNSAPATLNVEGLLQTFDSITSTQPVPVQDTDTVTTLLEKAGL